MTGMVADLGKKLHFFRAASLMDGVINDKGISTIVIGQRLRGFLNAPGREPCGKAHPVDVGGILKRYTVFFSEGRSLHIQVHTAAAGHRAEQTAYGSYDRYALRLVVIALFRISPSGYCLKNFWIRGEICFLFSASYAIRFVVQTLVCVW